MNHRSARALAVLATTALAATTPAVAVADHHLPSGFEEDCDAEKPPDFCVDREEPPIPDPPPGGEGPPDPDPGEPAGPPMYGHYSPGLGTDPDGNNCWIVELDTVSEDPPDGETSWTYVDALARIASFHENGAAYDVCPAVIVDLAGEVGASYFAGAFVPDASLSVDPGTAVTGLPTYLEVTQDGPPAPVSVGTLFGDLVLTVAQPTWEVDWGDGDGFQPVTSLGGPYPDGDVTHTYQVVGDYTITWRTHWTASVTIGPLGPFSLTPVQEETAMTVPVEEVEAVVTG